MTSAEARTQEFLNLNNSKDQLHFAMPTQEHNVINNEKKG